MLEQHHINHERRRHERYSLATPVWIQPCDPGQPLLTYGPLPGRCVDVSLGGLRVQTIAPILASSAHLRFETPDGFVITTAGSITWERAVAPGVWEYGLKFQEELLEEVIERMLPVAMSVG
jgi:hypothetical protein